MAVGGVRVHWGGVGVPPAVIRAVCSHKPCMVDYRGTVQGVKGLDYSFVILRKNVFQFVLAIQQPK